MTHGNKLAEGLGGADWLSAAGIKVDGRATGTRDSVGLILPANRSQYGATHATVYRKTDTEGGGFIVRWWKVRSSTEADDVGEYESGKLVKIAAAIMDDLRRPEKAAEEQPRENYDSRYAAA